MSIKYRWTDEQIALLKWAYAAGNPKELKLRVDKVVAKTGFPRTIVQKRAEREGVAGTYRPWSEAEKRFLLENAGRLRADKIAHELHRGLAATYAMMSALDMSARLREGYSLPDVAQAFGVSLQRVNRWLENKWIHRIN